MINLFRSKDHKWIFQKNISSRDQIFEFLDAAKNFGNYANPSLMLQELKGRGVYRGRSSSGSTNTFGVRRSQMKFYMFGYSYPESAKETFCQSPMTKSIMDDPSEDNISKTSLINLFSLQFPHPFSNTPSCFRIHVGRLLVKLLTDNRINKKIYIDEFCYFLPFLEEINEEIYEELIDSILEFRKLTFIEKDLLFKKVDNYDDVFANIFHECNYYFLRIFSSLGALRIVGDPLYNDGNLHSFIHGTSTKRTDAYKSGASYSGYVKLNDGMEEYVELLLSSCSPFDKVVERSDPEMRSTEDFINEIYINKPLEYLYAIDKYYDSEYRVNTIVNEMLHESRYGTRDGRSFEAALKELFSMFEQAHNVELIGGSGNTDLLCTMRDENDSFYKINVDAKTAHHSTQQLNPARLTEHLRRHGSKYCIVVSSRFASGVRNDIRNTNIVAIDSETLANYCKAVYKHDTNSYIDFSLIDHVIQNNLGTNISAILQNQVDLLYRL